MTHPSYTIYDLPLPQPSVVYDRKGTELYTFFNEQREPITYPAISPIMIDAITSIEDKSFWENNGFDLLSLSKSIFILAKARYFGNDVLE